MCLVKIEKNSFYRKTVVPASGGVVMAPRFKDMAISGGATVTLKGGLNPQRMAVSGSVPASPLFGAGELTGATFRTYTSGVSLSGAQSLPVLQMYKVEEGASITQGQYEHAYRSGSTSNPQVGDKLFIMSSYIDGESTWLEENFDGADKSLGEVRMLGDQGTATLSLEDAYLELPDASRLLSDGGTAFMQRSRHGPNAKKNNLERFFSDTMYNRGPGQVFGNRVYIKPDKPSRIKGVWTAQVDKRKGNEEWVFSKPYWQWKDIKNHVKYAHKNPVTDDIDAAKEGTPNNTIFDHIAVQSNVNSVWTAKDDAPLLQSVVELSTEKKLTGGQSLKMWHLWQHIDDWSVVRKVESSLGRRKINPQCSKAAIYNIPEPPPALDMGAFNYNFNTEGNSVGQSPASGARGHGTMLSSEYPGLSEGGHLTDKRLSFPEINISMNIAKLFPSPQIEVSSSAARDMWGDKGWVYGHPPSAQTGPAATDYFAYGVKEIDNTEDDGSDGAGYGTSGIWSNSKGGLNTLLRSVCITFSNYKPDGYNTLDEFLAESLDDTYWIEGKGSEYQKNGRLESGSWFQDVSRSKIACGVIFQTFRGTSEYNLGLASQTAADSDQDIDSELIYAAALPMCRYNEGRFSTTADKGLYASGGFAKFDAAGITFAGNRLYSSEATDVGTCTNEGGAMTLAWDPRIGVSQLTYPSGTLSSTGTKLLPFNDDASSANYAGRPWGDSGSTWEPLWVAIPKDSWFDLKFVFDSQARFSASKGSKDGSGATAAQDFSMGQGLADVSGGTYSYTNASLMGDGNAQGYILDYGLTDPSTLFGVPLRCYISGAINPANDKVRPITTTAQDDIQPMTTPYLNIPIPMRRAPLVSEDSATNILRSNNLDCGSDMGGIQTSTWSMIGDEFPCKYMTIWVNNYRHTEYVDDGDYSNDTTDYAFWRGTYFNGTGTNLNPQGNTNQNINAASYRAADSKLYPSGLNAEAEVYIDKIEFKHWNNEHVNHSIEAGGLSRIVKLEQGECKSPAVTFHNTGNLYSDNLTDSVGIESSGRVAIGGTDTMTTMMKGLDPSGSFRGVNPGRFLCIGVDDPEDLPIQFNSGSNSAGNLSSLGDATPTVDAGDWIQSGYLLHNNFEISGDFGNVDRLVPDIAILSTAPPTKPVVSGSMNQGANAQMHGVIPYDGGFSRNAGASIAGRNFALYNPIASGGNSTTPTTNVMRTRQSKNLATGAIFSFEQTGTLATGSKGWVIDNLGSWFSAPGAQFPCLYSNVAGWAGAPSSKVATNNPASGEYVSGQAYLYSPEEVIFYPNGGSASNPNFYAGFNRLRVEGGTTQVSTYNEGSGGAINMGTGTTANFVSTDGYTQKGFQKVDVDIVGNRGSTDTDIDSEGYEEAWTQWSKWAPRENLLCSAKITGVPLSIGMNQGGSRIEGTAMITVDDTSIFNANADDRYVIFQIGRTTPAYDILPNDDGTYFTPSMGGPATITNSGASTQALGYHTMVKLSDISEPIQGNTVTLTVQDSGSTTPRTDGILRADDGKTLLCTDNNLSTLWISPLKYWITLGFFEDGNRAALGSAGAGNLDVSRSYESINTINTRPFDGVDKWHNDDTLSANFAGTTFTEFDYYYDTGSKGTKGESGLLVNPWSLAPGEPELTSLDLQDYGYGAYNQETGQGGEAGVKSVTRHKLSYINLDGLVTTKARPVNASNEPLILTLGLAVETNQKEVTVYSDEYLGTGVWASGAYWESPNIGSSIYTPTFIWRYHDNLPQINNFMVKPTYDALSEDVNLYSMTSQNLNSVDFSWGETTDSDVWYRMLMIDTQPIPHKYYKARIWAPLNDTPTESGTLTTATTKTWHSDVSTTYGRTISTTGSYDGTKGSEVLQTIDGLAGYASYLPSSSTAANGLLGISGSATAGTLAANTTEGLRGLDEYTFVMHAVPEDTAFSRNRFLFSQGSGASTSTNARGFDIQLNNNAQVVVQHGGAAMTGTSAIVGDGETPVSIIVTFSSGSSTRQEGPDLQLFVNGKREDYVISGTLAAVDAKDGSATENIIIGADYVATAGTIFAGKVEELILYEKRWEIVEKENEYRYPTTALSDVDSSDIGVTQNAKLFIFDYHNIRGKEATEVCESALISWRTTA